MIRIGVIGTANIAKNRMIPTILENADAEYMGVAVADLSEWDGSETEEEAKRLLQERLAMAEDFKAAFGGTVYNSYQELLDAEDVDAVYLPLPPSLHFKWAKAALTAGKHVLLEKPATISEADTAELIALSKSKNLAIIENYGFPYHNQFLKIQELLKEGLIGDLRLIRTAFGFPHRAANDFRYSKDFGGGALFDCGGYTLKLASKFMNGPCKLLAPQLTVTEGHEVDIYGSATMTDGQTVCQLAFGMDHAYKCELELWGSTGVLTAPRIYTAPAGFEIQLTLKNAEGEQIINVPASNQFGEILNAFMKAIKDPAFATSIREEIKLQSQLVQEFSACL